LGVDEQREFLSKEKQRRQAHVSGQTRDFDDEVRTCAQCGRVVGKKSYCIANKIDRCPYCGSTEARGATQAYTMDRGAVRRQIIAEGGRVNANPNTPQR